MKNYFESKFLIEDGNPKLMFRYNADKTKKNIFFKYYMGYDKKSGKPKYKEERMKGEHSFLWVKEDSPEKKIENANNWRVASKERKEREEAFKVRGGAFGKGSFVCLSECDFYEWFDGFIDEYEKTRSDGRMLRNTLKEFRRYLEQCGKADLASEITPKVLTRGVVAGYSEYLSKESKHKGEGARSYFKRFKTILSNATDKGLFEVSPANGVKVPGILEGQLEHVYLEPDELRRLVSALCEGGEQELARIIIFTFYSDCRPCEVQSLRYKDVNYEMKYINIKQSKVKDKSKKEIKMVPLTDDLLQVLPKPKKINPESNVFDCPDTTKFNRKVAKWCDKAGVRRFKWYDLRHSSTNDIAHNESVLDASEAAGHADIKTTQSNYISPQLKQKQSVAVRQTERYSLGEVYREESGSADARDSESAGMFEGMSLGELNKAMASIRARMKALGATR